jgi:hypothetical protein
MSSIQDVAPIVDWVIEILSTGTGKDIGDHESPENAKAPYAVVIFIDGTTYSGSLSLPDEMASMIVQVNSIGLTVKQARWMSDAVRRTMLARRSPSGAFQVSGPVVAGYKVIDRSPSGGPSVPIPEGPSDRRVYTIPERFIITVTPGD